MLTHIFYCFEDLFCSENQSNISVPSVYFVPRMKDKENKKTFLPTFKKNERDRKKLMDMVLKQLKALVTGPTSKAQAH